MKIHLLILALFASIEVTFGSNILFLNGAPSPSHHIYNRALVVGLASKGHNVTFLSPEDVKTSSPNIHYVLLERTYEILNSATMNILDFAWRPFLPYCEFVCDTILLSNGLDTIIAYPMDFKFDAVIYDFTFGPCLLPLLARFNYPPLISVTAFVNPPYTTDLIGGQKFPAYMPHYVSHYPREMTFVQRCYNTLLFLVDWLSREFQFYPNMDTKVRRKFKFDFPPLKELMQKTSLLFVNTDDAIDFPEPLQANMIQVGGLQISDTKPLSPEMEAFIKSAKNGTVLMSLGTNIKSNMLGEDRLRNILKTFAQLPDYNFLWKFESEIKDLPLSPTKNVMIEKFLPQNDILAHPEVVAFISHAGILSTHEAFWHGKPIIGMPFYVDQHQNIWKVINLGVGVKVDFRDLSDESFRSSIEAVLTSD